MASVENSMEFPLKTKYRITIQPSNPITGHIPWEYHNSKRVMYHKVHCSCNYNSQDTEATLVSIDRWMDEEDVAHIYNGILLTHKKEWNWVICSEMNGPRVCHTVWSKSGREKQIPYANTYMESKKKKKRFWWTWGQERNKDTDLENVLEDMWREKCKLGQSERVAWTYIHYQM